MAHSRQLRLNDPEQISSKLMELHEKPVQLVLHDSKVITGGIIRVDNNTVIIKNFRQKKISVVISNIQEIYLDTLC